MKSLLRDLSRGFLWVTVAMSGVCFVYWSVAFLSTADAAREAHCREMSDRTLLSVVSTMVLFLCVPRSPFYIEPAGGAK